MKNYIEVKHNPLGRREDVYCAVRPSSGGILYRGESLPFKAEPWRFKAEVETLSCVEAYRKLLDAIEEVLKEEEK